MSFCPRTSSFLLVVKRDKRTVQIPGISEFLTATLFVDKLFIGKQRELIFISIFRPTPFTWKFPQNTPYQINPFFPVWEYKKVVGELITLHSRDSWRKRWWKHLVEFLRSSPTPVIYWYGKWLEFVRGCHGVIAWRCGYITLSAGHHFFDLFV